MADLNALVGIDFSLIGTKLHAVYEQKKDGYAVLLAPSEQNAENGVSIKQLISDISDMLKGSISDEDKDKMEDNITGKLSGLSDNGGVAAGDIIVRLNMAYLYINKEADKEAVTEYAFQLQIVNDGLIPKAVSNIVDVTNVSVSVWNTTRQKVLDQMQLVSINKYLGLPETDGDE